MIPFTDADSGVVYSDVTAHPWWTWIYQRVILKPLGGMVVGGGGG